MPAREFDVVVLGATGVTGRNVVAYLQQRCEQTGLRWASAARDASKLARVLDECGGTAPSIHADVRNPASLRAMAERATVVVNLVGPYARYGDPVVDACIAHGCHYLDLTGEIPFVRRTIDRHGERARAAAVKVVQVCGFEALPVDVGVLLACQIARDRFAARLAEVDVEMAFTGWPPGAFRLSDGLSGGTMQSMAEAAGDPDAPLLCDPAALVEAPAAAASIRAQGSARFRMRRGANGLLLPMMPFAFINPPVVHRTAAILAAERGEPLTPFAYREGALVTPEALRPLRCVAAGLTTALQVAIAATSRARPAVRARVSGALARALPGSGFGPAADRLESWSWRFSILARTPAGERIEVEVRGQGHPGYLSTARMIGEAGLMLAEPGLTPERSGCLTPATALGPAAVRRLRHARVEFEIHAPTCARPPKMGGASLSRTTRAGS